MEEEARERERERNLSDYAIGAVVYFVERAGD